ncbi:tRNA threonylcarbamoyladenosine biosynthesis protein TsaB [Chitinophaga sp. CF118]|uniref:tRNA (adenosine(37)-N6)-threonylcarbamoyltransferase complex dimerization subunit type 1 TsaB n=1 Tax=Chitinophaga sp. CF118 TaxID=1884367 RepID=UPI0008E41FDE|nr:tRNA (adenosine(37)-N6)-threonylcarbamoyltransferase complex dimerization subunit type 1 TsaB [Chitinophaga sp. CF118]SFE73069.1 tRNA threonylcarbamoyladenosine biosynthesis protein TsaB [Chitinophaga sp. CF118]
MSLILNIDTATATGSVCLSKDGKPLQTLVNDQQRDHAATMILFVQEIMKTQKITSAQLDAVAVSAGPGSYTGLRVGVATAKGLCYAWGKPLIAVSTLQMMAQGMQQQLQDTTAFYCPMLDARRMEVYTALYKGDLSTIIPPEALILTPDAFREQLNQHKTYFFGDGSEKWQQLLPNHHNALFVPYKISAAHLSALSNAAFSRQEFVDVAYFSPFYLKPFHFNNKK